MYAQIDQTLFEWAGTHSLAVTTRYREEEVRSIEWTSAAGQRFQLWIEPPASPTSPFFRVRAWDFDHNSVDIPITPSNFIAALDQALSAIQQWIAEGDLEMR